MEQSVLTPSRRGGARVGAGRKRSPDSKVWDTVGTTGDNWLWLLLWCPGDPETVPSPRSAGLNELIDRGRRFWPNGPDAPPVPSGKPRKKRLPIRLKQLAEAQGVPADELVYRAVVEFLERQENK